LAGAKKTVKQKKEKMKKNWDGLRLSFRNVDDVAASLDWKGKPPKKLRPSQC